MKSRISNTVSNSSNNKKNHNINTDLDTDVGALEDLPAILLHPWGRHTLRVGSSYIPGQSYKEFRILPQIYTANHPIPIQIYVIAV